MIADVTRHLVARGILPNAAECPVNVFPGRTLVFLFYPEGREAIAAKVARHADGESEALRREFDVLSEQHDRYTGLAPAPIDFEETEKFSCLAMQKMAIRPTRLDELASAEPVSLRRFIAFMIGDDRRADKGDASADLLREAIGMLPPGIKSEAERISAERAWPECVARLSSVPQHGDLAINNFGFDGNAITVFDWEDYGAVSTAGFDFIVLLLSGTGFDHRRYNDCVEERVLGSRAEGWAAEIGAGVGLNRGNLFDLSAIFALMFYGMKCKHGYGQDVQANILGFLGTHLTKALADK